MSVALADQYIDSVLSGRIRPCKWIRLACKRHRDDQAKQSDPDYPYAFDAAKAEKVCKFLQLLPHTKAKWAAEKQKLRLEPWQAFLICSTFGWTHKATGLRRFTNVMYVIPRKNGKSLLAAGIGLYMLCADGEHGAEVYTGATSEKQAWEVFRPAKQMVERTTNLQRKYFIGVNAKNLNILSNGSKMEPVIGKPGDGASPHCAILDECHEIPDSVIRDTMRTGMGARQQPMLLQITTAGIDVSSPCFDDILEGRKMLEGAIDAPDTFFVEYTIDDDVEWNTIEAIRMANPNLGVSVNEGFLQAQLDAAIRNPRNQNTYKIKHLNVWTSSKSAYFNMLNWNKCRNYIFDEKTGKERLVTMQDYEGQFCYAGMDLASYKDIAALVFVFPEPDGQLAIFGQFFLPEAMAEEAGMDHYRGWADAGKITLTPGNMIDHNAIFDELLYARDHHTIRQVVFDPTQANPMMTMLVEEGFSIFRASQNAVTYSEPMKRTAALMDGERIIHGWEENDPMTWMISNVTSKTNKKEQEFPDKERPELKIDGPVAMLMAVAGVLNDEDDISVYESEEIKVFG